MFFFVLSQLDPNAGDSSVFCIVPYTMYSLNFIALLPLLLLLSAVGRWECVSLCVSLALRTGAHVLRPCVGKSKDVEYLFLDRLNWHTTH